jgi:tRNA pseudouridine55 synthase
VTSVPIDESRNGFFVLDKAAGFTSPDAVKTLSRALGLKKGGHSGTLDRFATGVLPILSGRYTRLMRFFMEGDKSYRAVIRFGAETDTLDPEGRIISRSPVPSHEAVESVLHLFRGDIMQAPPSFSAVHIDGERAWKRALSGERVELAERPVRIHRLESFPGKKIVQLSRLIARRALTYGPWRVT